MTATITIYSRAVSGSDASSGNLYDNVAGGNHSFMVYDPANGEPRLAFRGPSDGGVPGIALGGQLETGDSTPNCNNAPVSEDFMGRQITEAFSRPMAEQSNDFVEV